MDLQSFVTKVIEGFGGVVIPVEYALCQVLIPEEYQHYFQNKAELELAFDFEVAEENPRSEFVTFGSYIFEQVMEIVNQEACSTVRFAEIDRLTLSDPLKKIKAYLADESGKVEINRHQFIFGVWAVYQFRIAYILDEKMEASEQVWVNLVTGDISEEMKQEQKRIVYTNEPNQNYPIPDFMEINEGFRLAHAYVMEKAEKRRAQMSEDGQSKKDIERITNYYTELLKENQKRADRKGLSEEKRNEMMGRTKVIELERDKQIQEIIDKTKGQIVISLDHGLLYFIPMNAYEVSIAFRSETKALTLHYNPITKGFSRMDKVNADLAHI